jgi:transcriptional regulator with XRE-family HTH domain
MSNSSNLLPNTFGELLRHLRQRAHLTQEALGRAVGYSRAHVARLESNQRAPDVSTVRARFPQALHLATEDGTALRLIELAVVAHEVALKQESLETAPVERMEPTPHNLFEPLTSFIGRADELRELEQLFPTTRLLTLTGTGGTGKTRLALELAARMTHRQANPFVDGVWMAELASLSDPTTMSQTLLAMLGLQEEPSRPVLMTLTDGLHSKQHAER